MMRLAIAISLFLWCSPASAYYFATGTYTGNGTDDRSIDISDTSNPTVADFQPEFCLVKGKGTSTDFVVFIQGMGSDQSTNFRSSWSLGANKIQAMESTGFQVGTDSTVNTDTETYLYLCLAPSGDGDFATGVYSGNATDNRTIDISDTSNGGIADFTPEFVMAGCLSNDPNWRGANSHSGDDTSQFWNGANGTNRIQAFNANGFEVGSNADVNASGTSNCFYVAIAPVTNFTTSGNYAGDGSTDDWDHTVGFAPSWVVLKGGGTQESVQRTTANSGDDACRTGTWTCFGDDIQGFGSTTFQTGLGSSANVAATTFYWFALRTPAATTRRIAPIIFQ